MAGTGEIFFFIILMVLVIVRGYYFYYDISNLYGSYTRPYTLGLSGKTGDKLNLKCKTGVIHISPDTRYMCNDSGSCDPHNADGSINTSTTRSAVSDLEKCEGKTECSFTIPSKTDICSGCTESMMIGTYACQAKQE